MRLTPAQIDTIQSTVHAVLGEGAQVTLFGSRVDDSHKGAILTSALQAGHQHVSTLVKAGEAMIAKATQLMTP